MSIPGKFRIISVASGISAANFPMQDSDRFTPITWSDQIVDPYSAWISDIVESGRQIKNAGTNYVIIERDEEIMCRKDDGSEFAWILQPAGHGNFVIMFPHGDGVWTMDDTNAVFLRPSDGSTEQLFRFEALQD